jgi:hypothetical protein
VLCGPAPAPAADAAPRPLPISAHNCYPADGTADDRLAEALALGIDNIEIDLGWDEALGRLIVGHGARPRPGVAYPEFEAYLLPALEAHRRAPRADGAPTVLTIDWKTQDPAAVRRFRAFLDAHPDWFSSAPKAADSPLTPRRLTVCFTGADVAKRIYDELIPPGGTYRAFRDTVFGWGAYRADVAAYAPAPATAYHRFLTFHWSHIERGGPPLAGSWTAAEADRLVRLVALVHRQGFRARFYCLNGHTGLPSTPYRFPDDASARIRRRAAAEAGADWIAGDEYADLVRDLRDVARPDPPAPGAGARSE